jgi:hypothetical protein
LYGTDTERLLAEDRLAGLKGALSPTGMVRVGQGDVHRVHIWRLDDGVVAFHTTFDTVITGKGLCSTALTAGDQDGATASGFA